MQERLEGRTPAEPTQGGCAQGWFPVGDLCRTLLSAGHFTPHVLPLIFQKPQDTSFELSGIVLAGCVPGM